MTRPGIEPRSRDPVANILLLRPMANDKELKKNEQATTSSKSGFSKDHDKTIAEHVAKLISIQGRKLLVP